MVTGSHVCDISDEVGGSMDFSALVAPRRLKVGHTEPAETPVPSAQPVPTPPSSRKTSAPEPAKPAPSKTPVCWFGGNTQKLVYQHIKCFVFFFFFHIQVKSPRQSLKARARAKNQSQQKAEGMFICSKSLVLSFRKGESRGCVSVSDETLQSSLLGLIPA